MPKEKIEANLDPKYLAVIPHHILIDAILLPFFDLPSKLKLKTVCRSINSAVEQNILKDKYVKAELQGLLRLRYQESVLEQISAKTLLITLRNFMQTEKSVTELSRLWQFDTRSGWILSKNSGEAFQAIIKCFVAFESLFGRKLGLLAKDNMAEYTSYRTRWKAALEKLVDLSYANHQAIFFKGNKQQDLNVLKDKICLMISSLDILVPNLKEAQAPNYLSNYRKGLVALYHHLVAMLPSTGGVSYLLANTVIQSPAGPTPTSI